MNARLKSIAQYVGSIFATCFCEYLLNQYGVYNQIKLFFSTHSNRIYNFINIQFPLWEIVTFIVLICMFYFIITKFFFKNRGGGDVPAEYKKSKQEVFYGALDVFKEKHKFNNVEGNYTVSFQTDIQFSGKNLYINWIHPYCTQHGEIKAKMVLEGTLFKCHKMNCSMIYPSDKQLIERTKAEILSNLEYEWEKLNIAVEY